MIPISIASSTILSAEKTTKLLSNLLELKDKRNVELPDQISESINRLIKAQKSLVEKIDDYLHRPSSFTNEDNIDTVTTIVQTCPEFLATKNEWIGDLPCHSAAAAATNSAHKYLLLFAEVGLQHSIGGKDSRGGLLTSGYEGHNALHHIRHSQVFDTLRKHYPPLFYRKDVKRYRLLHEAAFSQSLDLVKYFCNLDPSCLYQITTHESFPVQIELPIHHAIHRFKNDESMEVVQYLLQKSVSYDISNKTIGGLFTKILHSDRNAFMPRRRNKWFLDLFVKKWGREEAWDCIERALSKNNDLDKLPILHQTIRYAPQYCSEVINRFPISIHACDPNNNDRLPIHVALETGMRFSLELTCLTTNSREYLKDVDPVTKWPPFVLAAMGTSCNLRTIYSLLHRHPEHVEMWCHHGSIG